MSSRVDTGRAAHVFAGVLPAALLAALILVSGAAAAKKRSEQASGAAANHVLGFSDWSSPVNLGLPVNTAAEESAPTLSRVMLICAHSFFFTPVA